MASPMMTAVKAGALELQHRVVMSPMTRLRCAPVTEAPRELNATYYAQRSSPGGLLVTECSYSELMGRGYVRAPGIHSDAQIDGWRLVRDAVHAKGGLVALQLFHAGRVTHSSLLPGDAQPVSASEMGMAGTLYVEGGVKKPYEVPRPLALEEIPGIVKNFADAAGTAVKGLGFDAVEIHAGNGYLLQQFMALKTNKRSDAYGGAVQNRCRLLLEVLDAVATEVGAERVGVKLQPGVTFSDLVEPEEDVLAQLDYLGPELDKRKLAYVCLSSLNGEPYFRFAGLEKPNVAADVWQHFRKGYKGTLMANGGLSIEAGQQLVKDGVADLISYGVPFIANASLPDLIAAGYATSQLNPGGFDAKVWYSKDPANDAKGYTDWPLVTP